MSDKSGLKPTVEGIYHLLTVLRDRELPTTPSDVGLGNVSNMPKASTGQAEEGKSMTTMMTPYTTAKAIKAQTVDVDAVESLVDAFYTAFEEGTVRIQSSIDRNG